MRVRRDDGAEEPLLGMTSLLDVMFILLIFFLVASSFTEEERDLEIKLPRADPDAALSAAPRVLVVNVRRDGRVTVGAKTLAIDDVARAVKEAVAGDPAQKILVRGDAAARHEHVAAVMRACRQGGVAEAHLGYDCVPTP